FARIGVHSRPARRLGRYFRSRLARRFSFDLADRIFKGEALLDDDLLRKPGLVGAQMRDQGFARALVNQLASFRATPVKSFHGTGYEPMIVGPRMSAAGLPNDVV